MATVLHNPLQFMQHNSQLTLHRSRKQSLRVWLHCRIEGIPIMPRNLWKILFHACRFIQFTFICHSFCTDSINRETCLFYFHQIVLFFYLCKASLCSTYKYTMHDFKLLHKENSLISMLLNSTISNDFKKSVFKSGQLWPHGSCKTHQWLNETVLYL